MPFPETEKKSMSSASNCALSADNAIWHANLTLLPKSEDSDEQIDYHYD
jgi:hypothetical protein